MLTRGLLTPVLAMALLVAGASVTDRPAAAQTVGSVFFSDGPGTGAPPVRLGSSTMIPVTQSDPRVDEYVTDVPTPGGLVVFDQALYVAAVPDSWATWSHGYEGTVYSTSGGEPLTMKMPAGTRAFQFYVEPDSFETFDVTATVTDGGRTVTRPVEGDSGARYFGFYATGTALLRTITVSSGDAFAVGEMAIHTGVEAAYLALGDSYSSGEGAPGSDPAYTGGRCHHSDRAWPERLSSMNPRMHLVSNFACSGATTEALMNMFNGRPPQLMELESIPQARIITVTMGGNDIGFADLLGDCVLAGCNEQLDRAREGLAKKGGLADKLAIAYAWIRSSAPYAHLVVVGYPRIFPSSVAEKRKCGWLQRDELVAAQKLSAGLDEVIGKTARAAGATYVSTLNSLRGHEECSESPWMYPIGLGGGSQRGHPDARGQKAIAQVVSNFLK